MLQDLLKGLRSFIFPRNCPVCKQGPLNEHQVLCATCYASLPFIVPPVGEALTGINHTWAVCHYQEPITNLIHRFKYQGKSQLQQLFGFLLIDCITAYNLPIHTIDLIVPIPLYPSKQRERGFNQAFLLAQHISNAYQIPVLENILIRDRQTPSQTTFSLKDRWTNQQGTFRITHPELVLHKHVLIVDDLLTSGATSHTAAYALKQAGALKVSIMTLAKA